MMRRYALPLATLILLVAAMLRLSQLVDYPPGPHFDEAANILIARSIAYDGADLFPIANSYQGRETLYHYLSVPFFWWVNDGVLALQLTSVFANLITIAAAIALGRVLFHGDRGQIIGIAVGVMMAFSFHQIFMSRQAYRAVTLPMMQALGLLFLWRGLQLKGRSSWLWLVIGGAFCGGALYTYMASRLLPLWLGITALILLIADRRHGRLRLKQGVVFFGAMAIVGLPMLQYALANPDIFFQRLNEVSEGEIEVSLQESIQRHLEMFFIRGDFGNLRYNVPGRPYFTLPEGLFLLVGIAVSVRRLLAKRTRPMQRAGYTLLLLAPLMIIPSVISVAGLPPSHMRSLAMVPLIFLLVAVGVESIIAFLQRVFVAIGHTSATLRPQNVGHLLAVVAIMPLILGGFAVHQTYLGWAKRADLFYQADGDMALVADWLPTHVDKTALVYIASFHREHPTITTAYVGPVTWLGGDSLFLPPADFTGLAVFSRSAPPAAAWHDFLAPYALDDVPQDPEGNPAVWAYRLPDDVDVTALLDAPVQPQRTPLFDLVGVDIPAVPAGETGTVTIGWRVNATPQFYRLRPIMTLQDAHGTSISSSDLFLLGTNNWRPGEVMIQRMQVDVPTGTPPGLYTLAVSWVDRDTDTYVSYIGADGSHAGIAASIGALQVTRPDVFGAPVSLPIANRQSVDVVLGVRLLGWNPPAAEMRPGQALRPVLFWQALPDVEMRPALELTLSLVGEAGIVPLWQGEPAYEPADWVDNELVTQRMQIETPREIAEGDYQLVLEVAGEAITLGPVRIAGQPRLFEPPPVATTVDARYDDTLLLHGYTVEQVQGAVQLDMVWSALRPVSEEYTVFVHLVDAGGSIVAQCDAMPQQNAYPTSLWVAGEYVLDSCQLTQVPPGMYTVRVGLYLQTTGLRLRVNDALQQPQEQSSEYVEIYIEIMDY